MAKHNAGDIMIPIEDYPHIPYWFTLRQAVAEIEKSQIDASGRTSLPRALLVFDEKYNLVGMCRRRDILRGLEPKFLRTMGVKHREEIFELETDPNLVDISEGKIGRAMQEQAETKVSEVMNPIVSTADYSDHIAKIIYKLLSRDLYMIPVLKDDKVVGVIRTVDVFHEIAKILL